MKYTFKIKNVSDKVITLYDKDPKGNVLTVLVKPEEEVYTYLPIKESEHIKVKKIKEEKT